MTLPSRVKVVEVGARDGLQNEPGTLPTALKVEFIDKLSTTGLSVIEAGSFVSPKAIPQMADTDEVMAQIERKSGVIYPTIAFNIKGLERAIAANVEEIAVGTAASETFSQRNTNCSIDESFKRSRTICEAAAAEGLRVRGYVSCVLGCPYEGETDPNLVAEMASEMAGMGCYEISLGDTIGTGTPEKAKTLIGAVAKRVSMETLALHFHDTYGQALANIYAGLELGVAVVDSSVSGLGGCPYAPGAAGNVASEDVLYMLNGLGIETGIDFDKLVEAGRFITDAIGRPPVSKVAQAMRAKAD
ncbi:MAG: hydroxymethylglutaryl-CoA lyase [Alphaproteobacteria bacterium]|nr:hydroxymethylglutaryl-CoA lyase [Alphaproteobacteria bacterium]